MRKRGLTFTRTRVTSDDIFNWTRHWYDYRGRGDLEGDEIMTGGAANLLRDYGSRARIAEAFMRGTLPSYQEDYISGLLSKFDLIAAQYRLENNCALTKPGKELRRNQMADKFMIEWTGVLEEDGGSPEDGGQARIAHVDEGGLGLSTLFPRMISWHEGTDRDHTDFKACVGKKVRITLEVIE